MAKRITVLTILFFIVIAISAQNPKPYKSYFGLNLMQNVNAGTEHYAIIRVYDNGDVEHKILSRRNWMLQFAGHQSSEANPDSINFFLKHDIDVHTLQYIWKLRYAEYPYKSQIYTTGWAHKAYAPSDSQLRFLKKYGFENLNSFIYGDNLVKLLQDMMSPEWVDNYCNLQ